jgi:hypothetical protein
MHQFSQKYAIIQLFEEVAVGTTFASSNWPLHATVADTFAIEWDTPTLLRHLKAGLHSHPFATSHALDDTVLGVNADVKVTLLQETDSLMNLHDDIITILKQGGWAPNDPQFAGAGFLPHATVQSHNRLHKGAE